jgi:hypothetical protein
LFKKDAILRCGHLEWYHRGACENAISTHAVQSDALTFMQVVSGCDSGVEHLKRAGVPISRLVKTGRIEVFLG